MVGSDPQDRMRLDTPCWKLSSLGGCFRPPVIHRSNQVLRLRQESTLPVRLEGPPGKHARQSHGQFKIDVRTCRSGVWIAKEPAVAAAGCARSWAGVHSEVAFSSPPYSSRSPIVRDSEIYCGTGGLFPACRLGWHRVPSTKICVQSWPGGLVSWFPTPPWSPGRTKS